MNRFKTLRLLVAEDNETSREIIVEQLKFFNVQTDAVANGTEALELWRAHTYAIVLTDLQMPSMDGWQLAREIRKAEAGLEKQTPIIALTASVINEELERCRTVGINDFIAKPTDLETLKLIIEKWTPFNFSTSKEATSTRDINEFMGIEVDHNINLPIWEKDALKKMVGNDQSAYETFLEKFLKRLETQTDNLLKSTAKEELPAAATIAHSLKTTARSIGAMQLGKICEQIELAARNDEVKVFVDHLDQLKSALHTLKQTIQAFHNKAS